MISGRKEQAKGPRPYSLLSWLLMAFTMLNSFTVASKRCKKNWTVGSTVIEINSAAPKHCKPRAQDKKIARTKSFGSKVSDSYSNDC